MRNHPMQDNGYVAHANVKLMRALDSTLIYLLYVYGKVIKVRKENIHRWSKKYQSHSCRLQPQFCQRTL